MKAFLKINNDETFSMKTLYHQKIIQIFQENGSKYDAFENTNTFSIGLLDKVKDALIDINVSVEEVKEFDRKNVKQKTASFNRDQVFFVFSRQVFKYL